MAVYSRVIRGPLNSKKHNRLLPPHSHLPLPLPVHDKIPATIKRRHNLSSKNFNPPPLFTLYTIRFPPRTTAMNNPQSTLPPGFRFHPTDEELIFHYLSKKVTSTPFPDSIIAEVDIYKFDPWDLPGKAVFGEKEWYFFSPRDRKYPNGVRPNRAAASGYWKATGTDKTIIASASEGGHANIGVKKALVFYQGKPPKGIKTNWIMHEYRIAQPANTSINKPPLKLRDASMRLDDWVLCRIYKKSNAVPPSITAAMDDEQEQEDSFMEESLKSHHNPSTIQEQKPPSLSNMLDAMDSSVFGHLFSDIQYSDSTTAFGPSPTVNYGSFCQSNDILPNLTPWNSEAQNMANQLKRQRSNIDGDVPCPSKKLTMSSAFTTNPNQPDLPQSYFNPSLFNQALLLNPNYHHFQG